MRCVAMATEPAGLSEETIACIPSAIQCGHAAIDRYGALSELLEYSRNSPSQGGKYNLRALLTHAGLCVSLIVFCRDCALERWRLSSKLSLAAAYRQQQQLCGNPPYVGSHSLRVEGRIPSVLRVAFPRG